MGPPRGGRKQGHPTRFNTAALAVDAPKDHGTEKTRVRQGAEQGTSLQPRGAGIMVVTGGVEFTSSRSTAKWRRYRGS